jgi:hypothetical protein
MPGLRLWPRNESESLKLPRTTVAVTAGRRVASPGNCAMQGRLFGFRCRSNWTRSAGPGGLTLAATTSSVERSNDEARFASGSNLHRKAGSGHGLQAMRDDSGRPG